MHRFYLINATDILSVPDSWGVFWVGSYEGGDYHIYLSLRFKLWKTNLRNLKYFFLPLLLIKLFASLALHSKHWAFIVDVFIQLYKYVFTNHILCSLRLKKVSYSKNNHSNFRKTLKKRKPCVSFCFYLKHFRVDTVFRSWQLYRPKMFHVRHFESD